NDKPGDAERKITVRFLNIKEKHDLFEISSEPALYIVASGKIQLLSRSSIVMPNIKQRKDYGADAIHSLKATAIETNLGSDITLEDRSDASSNGEFEVEDDLVVEYDLFPGDSIGHLAILTGSWNELYVSRNSLAGKTTTPRP